MKRGEKTLACVLAGLTLCGSARAISDPSANPYLDIVGKNVFGLKPPPPPPDPEANKPPPPPITLTGITTLLGKKRALMKTPPVAAKPGEPAREQSYILTIGQREGDIEVLDIDEKAGAVKVKYAGNENTLTFEKNGPKIAATPAPAAPPGIPSPGGAVPPPVMSAPPASAAPASMPAFGTPGVTRPLRMPGATGAQSSYSPGTTAQPTASTVSGYAAPAGTTVAAGGQTGVSLSGLGGAASGVPQFKSWPPEEHNLTPEQEAALYLLQKKANPKVDFPGLPGFDENSLNQPAQSSGNQHQTTQPTLPLAPGVRPILPQ